MELATVIVMDDGFQNPQLASVPSISLAPAACFAKNELMDVGGSISTIHTLRCVVERYLDAPRCSRATNDGGLPSTKRRCGIGEPVRLRTDIGIDSRNLFWNRFRTGIERVSTRTTCRAIQKSVVSTP